MLKLRLLALASLLVITSFATTSEAQNVLILDYGTNTATAQTAAANLGLAATVTVDDVGFQAELTGGTTWDLVLVDNPCHGMGTADLSAYIDGGGAAVVTYWNLDIAPDLQASFDIVAAIDFFAPQEIVDSTGGTHEIWTTPNPLTALPIAAGASPWFDNGDTLTSGVAGIATTVGTFTVGGDAMRVLGAADAVLMAHDSDSLQQPEITQWWENAITLVTVPPTCDRVTSLTCVSDPPDCTPVSGGDVILSWVNDTALCAYDSIDVERDGIVIATLGGAAITHTDVGAPSGPHTYRVIANCVDPCGPASGTSCSLVHCPNPNQVLLLDYGTNTNVMQNALSLAGFTAVVTVDDVSFQAELSGGTPWAAVFVDNPCHGMGTAALSDYINAGGRAAVSYWNLDTAPDLQAAFDITSAIDFFAPQEVSDSSAGHCVWTTPNPLSVLPIDAAASPWFDNGDELTFVSAGFTEEVGAFPSGNPAAIAKNSATSEAILTAFDFDSMLNPDIDQFAENIIEFVFNGCGPPPCCFPVFALSCTNDCDTGNVTLSWTDGDATGGDPYVEVTIARDGTTIGTALAGDESFVDTGAADGPHTYSVTASCSPCPDDSATRTCNVDVISGGAAAHVVWDPPETAGGLTPSADLLRDELDAAGISYITVTALADIPCSDAGTTIWAITGTFPSNHALTGPEGTQLRDHVAAGGCLYFEGGDTWGFDLQTDFQQVDGVADGTALDGDDSYLEMDGSDFDIALMGGFLDVAYIQDQAGNDWTDQLQPAIGGDSGTCGGDAGTIWSETFGSYITGVYYATDDSCGRVISQSWEFGGFGGSQADLLSANLAALPCSGVMPGELFRRGDANRDGGYDISDAVFTLSELFVPGSPSSQCNDATDSNDDGGKDISDAVFTLSALFVPGSPVPAAPGSMSCGTDPTMDALDCATYALCP